MKHLTRLLLAFLVMACTFTSCDFGADATFDDKLLFSNGGKWEAPSQAKPETNKWYFVYYENGYGKEWDEGEDIFEDDLKEHGNGWFTWEVDAANLIHINFMDNGGAEVPQSYTLTTLTAAKLEYTGDNNKKYSFTKVVNK